MKHTFAIVVCKNKTQARKARAKIRKLFRYEGETPEIDEHNKQRGTLITFRLKIPGRGGERREVITNVLNVAKRLESIDDWAFDIW